LILTKHPHHLVLLVATPTPSHKTDNVVEAAICKLAVGLTTLTPILPFVCAEYLDFQ
jgi:hypothetical protein